jgi:hypothetical protein
MNPAPVGASPPPLTPAPAGGRGAAAAPLRLEERTSSDRHQSLSEGPRGQLRTRVVIRRYPHSQCEATITRRPETTTRRRGCSRGLSPGATRHGFEEEKLEKVARSAARARAMARRAIQAGGLDHMLTLTYRENRTDAAQCQEDLRKFLRLIRKEMGEEFKYVAVFERQKRGAGHWHLAVAGWQPVRKLRELWRRVVGEGNIDVRAWSRQGRPGDCSAKLAGYLAKYISKSLEDHLDCAHRYRRSHNIKIDVQVELVDEADLGQVARAVFDRELGRPPAYFHCTEKGARAFLWACSWGALTVVPRRSQASISSCIFGHGSGAGH